MYYHGAIPVDYYYLVNRVLLLKEVMVRSVVDKFLFKVYNSSHQSRAWDDFGLFSGARDQTCFGGVSLHTWDCWLPGWAAQSRANFGKTWLTVHFTCILQQRQLILSGNIYCSLLQDIVIVQGVSPGGVYEAQFGDHNYRVLWKVSHLLWPIE